MQKGKAITLNGRSHQISLDQIRSDPHSMVSINRWYAAHATAPMQQPQCKYKQTLLPSVALLNSPAVVVLNVRQSRSKSTCNMNQYILTVSTSVAGDSYRQNPNQCLYNATFNHLGPSIDGDSRDGWEYQASSQNLHAYDPDHESWQRPNACIGLSTLQLPPNLQIGNG